MQIKQIVSYILYLLGLLFVAYILRQSWQEVTAHLRGIGPLPLLVSTLAMLAHTYIGCWLLHRLFLSSGVSLGLSSTCRIFYLSQMAKYLPGVIWGFVMQASLLESESAMKKVVFANLRLMLIMTGSFFFFSLGLVAGIVHLPIGLLLASCAVAVIYLTRNLPLESILPGPLKRLVPSYFIEGGKSHTPGTPGLAASCLCLFLTYLLSVIAIVSALYELSIVQLLEIAAYQSLAWVAGILSFIVPAGMGIREAVFMLLGNLAGDLTQDQIQSIAIITRFIQILQDLLFSLGALLLFKTGLLR